MDLQRPPLHLEVDHHDVEGQVEAEEDKGQRHKVDSELPLGGGVERLLAARHRVEPEHAVETRPRFFKGLLPAQGTPFIGQCGAAAFPHL